MNTPLKILVIDDDISLTSTLKTSLEARGHEVTVINNGKKALKSIEKLQKDSYNIIILDLMIPGTSGWEILALIRSLPNTCRYPVIMLTGVDDESSETRALYDGADDYVTKPFTLKVLIARIEANVRKKDSSNLIDFELSFSDGQFEELTKREKEILSYIIKGYSNKDIAQHLFITEGTVINHIKNIFQKLKVSSRIQAAIVGLKYKLT